MVIVVAVYYLLFLLSSSSRGSNFVGDVLLERMLRIAPMPRSLVDSDVVLCGCLSIFLVIACVISASRSSSVVVSVCVGAIVVLITFMIVLVGVAVEKVLRFVSISWSIMLSENMFV